MPRLGSLRALRAPLRCAVLTLSLALSRPIATNRGKRLYLAVGAIAGMAVTPLLLWGEGATAHSLAALLAAVAEVSLFLMWLSFFGAMRLGDTLTLLVMSYGVGALLFLATLIGGQGALVAASIAFPLLSVASLMLSGRLISQRGGSELFDGDGSALVQAGEPTGTKGPSSIFKSIPALKMTLALACYSLAFSLLSAMAFSGGAALPAGYLVEPVCIVVLAGVYILYAQFAKDAAKPYALYRAVAPVMGLGFACLAALVGQPAIGGGMVVTGYLLFEVLALNDYCNIVKANDASLFRTMAFGRLAISAGMLVGWAVGFFADHASFTALALPAWPSCSSQPPLCSLIAIACPLASIADDRAIREERDMRPSKGTALANFAVSRKLSKRETEVFGYLIAGRTTSYIAERLFVAESTVRAHVYNIYQKADVHSRMELMDAFDAFWSEES